MFRRLCSTSLLIVIGAGLLTIARPGAAQEPPPIPGTLALEGTVDKTYAGGNAIIVKATDGIEHLFHFTKGTAVHGAAETEAAFNGLTAGSRGSSTTL